MKPHSITALIGRFFRRKLDPLTARERVKAAYRQKCVICGMGDEPVFGRGQWVHEGVVSLIICDASDLRTAHTDRLLALYRQLYRGWREGLR